MKKTLLLPLTTIILIIFCSCSIQDNIIENTNTNLLTEDPINRFNNFKKSFENIDDTKKISAVVYGEYIDLPIKDICSIEKEFLDLSEKNINKYQTKDIPQKFVGIKDDFRNEIMTDYKYFLEKCKDITVITDLEELKEYANDTKSVSSEQEQKYCNYVYSIMSSYVKTAYVYSNIYDMLSTQMDVSFLTTPYLALYETANSIYHVDSISDLSKLAAETTEISDKTYEVFNIIGQEAINMSKVEEKTNINSESQSTSYTDGMYKVGVDIPAGEYVAYPTSDSCKGYFCISSDANQDDIITNDNFVGQRYFSISDGQYLELSRCEATKNK
ncbi:MAG: hypothetical protein Q4D26_12090 [Clostridia bacterium]|nr:hypothetical protein [Clostridia bacterium]